MISNLKNTYKKLIDILSFTPLFKWSTGSIGYWFAFFQLFHINERLNNAKSTLSMTIQFWLTNKISANLFPLIKLLTGIGVGLISIISLLLLIRIVTITFKFNRWALVSSYSLLAILYFSFQSYIYAVGTHFDFSILVLNSHTVFNKDMLLAALPYTRVIPIIFMIITITWIIYSEMKHKTFSSIKIINQTKTAMLSILFYIALILIPIKSLDILFSFNQSVYYYFKHQITQSLFQEKIDKNEYPLLNDSFQYSNKLNSNIANSKIKPHIFIIMIESFNAQFIESKNSNQVEYMPYFNSLIKEGVYIEQFYGNSIQSCKGQFALLTSVIPLVSELGFRFDTTHYKPFTQYLQNNGYHATFYQAHGNLLNDNTRGFLRNIKFDEILTARQTTTKKDDPFIFGWGIQDKAFYKHFFNYFDTFIAKNPNKPILSILPTIFTHNNTISLPEHMRTIYKNPTISYEHYANVLNLSDTHLKFFIESLKERGIYENSILIITGDHSRSSGKVAPSNNQIGCHNDTFKVPFLMIWPDKLKATRIKDINYSQVDIGPTLLDLLSIPVKNHHFQGKSIFLPTDQQHPTYLVQPYDGIFLSVIKHPLKYIKHMQTNTEYLYDLSNDTNETNNIINKIKANELNQFREDTNTILKTSRLVKRNQLFPESY